jgi:hypothetical protein
MSSQAGLLVAGPVLASYGYTPFYLRHSFRDRRFSGANEFSKCATTAEHHLYDRVSKKRRARDQTGERCDVLSRYSANHRPSVAAVISANGLNGNFTNKAITDAKGNLLLVNPAPG